MYWTNEIKDFIEFLFLLILASYKRKYQRVLDDLKKNIKNIKRYMFIIGIFENLNIEIIYNSAIKR